VLQGSSGIAAVSPVNAQLTTSVKKSNKVVKDRNTASSVSQLYVKNGAYSIQSISLENEENVHTLTTL